MTHRSAGSGPGVPRIWLLPIITLTAILGVTVTGVLSRSLVLDLVAWWPVWFLVGVAATLTRGRRVGRVRPSGLVSLLATAVLVLFVIGHLGGWAAMPSVSARLIGPTPGSFTTAALSARVDGEVHVGQGGSFLYQVSPVRRGGEVGVPEAVEQIRGDAISTMLTAPADPGFYSFSGWAIQLSPQPTWSLTFEGEIAADLASLRVSGIQLSGSGSVTLGRAGSASPASVEGAFHLVVPSDTPVRVVGSALVPSTWERLSDGWRSPVSGDGWVISVTEGSVVSLAEG